MIFDVTKIKTIKNLSIFKKKMKSTIYSLLTNDDGETITVVYLTRIECLSMANLTLLKNHSFDFPIGFVGTYQGIDYVAVSGRPGSINKEVGQNSVHVYETKKFSKIFEKTFTENILNVAVSKNIVACAFAGRVEVWNTNAKLLVHNIKCGFNIFSPLVISPDSKILITSGNTPELVSIRPGLSAMIRSIETSIGEYFTCAAFSPDATKLAVAGGKNVVVIRTGTLVSSRLIQCTEVIKTLCISDDSRIAAVTDTAINFIDGKSMCIKKTLEVTGGPYSAVGWLGRTVFVAAINGTAKLVKFSGSVEKDSLLR